MIVELILCPSLIHLGAVLQEGTTCMPYKALQLVRGPPCAKERTPWEERAAHPSTSCYLHRLIICLQFRDRVALPCNTGGAPGTGVCGDFAYTPRLQDSPISRRRYIAAHDSSSASLEYFTSPSNSACSTDGAQAASYNRCKEPSMIHIAVHAKMSCITLLLT